VKPPHSLTDGELKAYAEEHLQYEVDMLTWAAGTLAFFAPHKDKGLIPWTINNALVESFASHARNLIDFLYSRSCRKDYDTDIVIQDYVAADVLAEVLPEISTLLYEALIKANKQVAHLTLDRIKYEKAGKEWEFIEIVRHIYQAFASIAPHIPNSKISDELRQKLSKTQVVIHIVDVSIINAPDSRPIGVSLSFRQANEIAPSV